MNDQQIIELLRARDEAALRALSQKYGGRCLRIAQKLLSPEDAEECVSDVMMQVWEAIPPAVPDNLEAFVVTVARRTAINMHEKANAQKRGGGAQPASLDEIGEQIAAPETIEDAVQHRLLTAAVERFLDALSADARTVFVACYRLGLSPKEIAESYGLTGGQVRISLLRTRRKLRRYLEKEGLL